MTSKPRLLYVAGSQPVELPPRETLLQATRRRILRDFSAKPWMRGEGAQFFTAERLAAMAAENEARRRRRK